MIMQVHDELVFEVHADDEARLLQEVSRLMDSAAELAVPLEVEAHGGDNWEQAH